MSGVACACTVACELERRVLAIHPRGATDFPNSVVPTGRSWLSAADLVSAHFDVICDFFVDPLDIAVNGRAVYGRPCHTIQMLTAGGSLQAALCKRQALGAAGMMMMIDDD